RATMLGVDLRITVHVENIAGDEYVGSAKQHHRVAAADGSMRMKELQGFAVVDEAVQILLPRLSRPQRLCHSRLTTGTWGQHHELHGLVRPDLRAWVEAFIEGRIAGKQRTAALAQHGIATDVVCSAARIDDEVDRLDGR